MPLYVAVSVSSRLGLPLAFQQTGDYYVFGHAVAELALAYDAFYLAAQALCYFCAALVCGEKMYLYFIEACFIKKKTHKFYEAFMNDAFALVFLADPVTYLRFL